MSATFPVTDADDPRLARFHAGIYWDAFAAQHEPLAAWQRALRGEAPYELRVRLVGEDASICYERYPTSNVGFVTYMVVAPAARGQGIGERLLREAVDELCAEGAPLVLGEVNDPRLRGNWERLARFQRWGARVIEGRYVQPALGEGLARDRGLLLLALAGSRALPASVDGVRVRSFVRELYACCEGGEVDPEVAFADAARLVSLSHGDP